MGNKMSSVDFVTVLPPEILCMVLSFLPLKEVLKCLRVSKGWKEVILELNVYWFKQLSELNLSLSSLSDLSLHNCRTSDIFLEMKRYLVQLQSVEYSCILPECYPAYCASKCYVMSQQNVVVRTDTSGLCIDRLFTVGKVVYAQTLYKRSADIPHGIGWAHFSKNNCAYWLDYSTKMGSCCSIVEDSLVHSFNFFDEDCFKARGRSAIGSRLMVECCEECSLCVMCVKSEDPRDDCCTETKENENDFDMKVVSLGDMHHKPQLLNFSAAICKKLLKNHTHVIPMLKNTSFRLSKVISTRKGHTEFGVCKEHSVLLFNGGYATSIDLQTQLPQEELLTDPTVKISTVCLTCKYHFPAQDEIITFGDSAQKIQTMFTKIYGKPCITDDELVEVSWNDTLISVVYIGKQLSILRSWKQPSPDNSEHNYWLVFSETGKLYKKVQWKCPAYDFGCSGTVEYLVNLEAIQWLNDIRNSPPAVLLTIMLSDSNGKLQFLSVQRNQGLKTNQEEVHAVNFCFVK